MIKKIFEFICTYLALLFGIFLYLICKPEVVTGVEWIVIKIIVILTILFLMTHYTIYEVIPYLRENYEK